MPAARKQGTLLARNSVQDDDEPSQQWLSGHSFSDHRIDLPCPRDIGVSRLVVTHLLFYSAAEINGRVIGLAGHSRRYKASVIDEVKYRLFRRREAQKLGLELDDEL